MMMTIEQLIAANPEATDAQIVALWAPMLVLTRRKIALGDLTPLLRTGMLMSRLKAFVAGTYTLASPLPAGVTEQLRAGLSEFLDHLNDRNMQNLDTTDPTFAAMTHQMMAGLLAAGEITQEMIGAIYALGGGLAHGPISEADVAAARVRMRVEAIKAAEIRWWQDRLAIVERLADTVDMFCPSLYTFWSNGDSFKLAYWQLNARLLIAEAKKYLKPVYPFVWECYHDNGSGNHNVPVSMDYWRGMLETCKEADGVVAWGGYQQAWDADAEWLRVLGDVI